MNASLNISWQTVTVLLALLALAAFAMYLDRNVVATIIALVGGPVLAQMPPMVSHGPPVPAAAPPAPKASADSGTATSDR